MIHGSKRTVRRLGFFIATKARWAPASFHQQDELPLKAVGVFLALEADDRRPWLRVEQHERAGVPANPLGNALLRLLVAQAGEILTIAAAFLEDALDALVAPSSHSEVDRVDAVRNVEPMILLVPMAGATFDDFDARSRLGGLPPCTRHLALAALFAIILRPSCLTIDFGLPLAFLDRLGR